LARESADAYMDFFNSMFSYYQRSTQEVEGTTGRKLSRTR
jgi:hypothetical protein